MAALYLITSACAAPRAAETPIAGRSGPRVVVVSVDAAADWILDSLLASGDLAPAGGFAFLSRNGARAEAMIPINVASTAPSHAAMFTGTLPSRNGIIANGFRVLGTDIGARASGFATRLDAEPIWITAMRQGKRVVCATAPFADLTGPGRRCTRTLPYGVTESRGGLVRLRPDTGTLAGRQSVVLRAHEGALALRVGSSNIPLFARAERTRAGSWTVTLDFDSSDANGSVVKLREGESGDIPIPVAGRRLHATARLRQVAADLSDVQLYFGFTVGTPRGEATDDPYVRMLDSAIGLFPGDIDNRGLTRGEITAEEWHQQNEGLGRYFQKVVLRELAAADWDLLLTYLPLIDNAEHRFLLADARQPDYSAEAGKRRERYGEHVLRSYRFVDDVLRSYFAAAPPGTHFVIVSDHGMVPTHSTVLLHNYLEDRGFRVAPDSVAEVAALIDQASANVYVNVKGREPKGRVERSSYDDVVRRLTAALRDLRDPVTGEAILKTVATRPELERLGLHSSAHSGDVFVSATPGWGLTGRYVAGAPFILPTSQEPDTQDSLVAVHPSGKAFYREASLELSSGLHGHTGDERRIEAIFIAYGPRVGRLTLGRVRAIDVAPSIAGLLGISPSPQTQGRSVIPAARR